MAILAECIHVFDQAEREKEQTEAAAFRATPAAGGSAALSAGKPVEERLLGKGVAMRKDIEQKRAEAEAEVARSLTFKPGDALRLNVHQFWPYSLAYSACFLLRAE